MIRFTSNRYKIGVKSLVPVHENMLYFVIYVRLLPESGRMLSLM
jgi:hypothetical protein